MTCNVGSPWLVLAAYALAGVFTLAGALTFAELSTMMPRSGGHYNFIGAAFGRLWAFLYGWMATLIDGAGSGAALAIVFAIFFNDLIGGTLSDGGAKLVTVGALAAVTAVNLATVHANGVVATIVTVLKVALVAGIGIAAFLLGDGTWAHFGMSGAAGTCEGIPASAKLGMAGFGAAVVGALWSYNGWAAVSYVAEEVGNPNRNIPRAMIGGTLLIMALYLLANAGYFFALPPEAVASVPEDQSVAGAVLVRLLGAGGASIMAAGLMVSVFGALHANSLVMSRIPFAMARDGLLPKTFAAVSPHTRVPTHAVVLIGGVATVYAITGTFDILTDLIVFALLLFNGLAVASIYVLRRTMPDVDRPYRVWGYPVVPGLFLFATAYLVVNTFIATPGRALAGVGIIALGLPVYAYYARRLPPSKPEDFVEPAPEPPSEDPS